MYIDLQFSSSVKDVFEISQIINIKPSSYNNIGDKSKTGKILDFSQINFYLLENFYEDTNLLFDKFVLLLNPYLPCLRKYISDNKCDVHICVVIREDSDRYSISFSKEIISFLAQLNSSLDFDFI